MAHESAVTAVYAFCRFPDDYAAMVEYIIQLGGDTDTIGAMAGGIFGARNGAASLPEEPLAEPGAARGDRKPCPPALRSASGLNEVPHLDAGAAQADLRPPSSRTLAGRWRAALQRRFFLPSFDFRLRKAQVDLRPPSSRTLAGPLEGGAPATLLLPELRLPTQESAGGPAPSIIPDPSRPLEGGAPATLLLPELRLPTQESAGGPAPSIIPDPSRPLEGGAPAALLSSRASTSDSGKRRWTCALHHPGP